LKTGIRRISLTVTPSRATLGLGAVLAVLAVCGVWVAISASNAVAAAAQDREVSTSYESARYAFAAEESAELKYRHEPWADARKELAALAAEVDASLRQAAAHGDTQDGVIVPELVDGHARYLQATLRLLDAVDAGDVALIRSIESQDVDPTFNAVQQRMTTEATEDAARAASSLNHVSSLQREVLIASPFVLILGFTLLATFWSSLERRQLDVLRAEQRVLASSESRFRGLVQNSFDPVLLLDADGRILYSSPAVQKRWGYETVIGNDSWSFVEPEDRPRVASLWAEMMAHPGETVTAEFRARTASGERVDLEATGFNLLGDASVGGLVVNCHDVTERKRVEAQLLQSQKMESIGRLAGGVAHDFNNLLTGIIGFCELAGLSLERGHPAASDLAEAVGAANKAADLTRQLLAFARQQVIKPEDSNLNDLVCELQPLLGRLIGERVELVCALSPQPLIAQVDRSQFGQVLLNLAVNASDAMPGGGSLTIESSRTVLDDAYCAAHFDASPGTYALIAVTDTGGGIPPDVLPRIFEPFFTTKPPGQGTGLGLATCYGIAMQARGHIAVDSEPGQGSTFKIYLPLVPAASDSTAPALVREEPPVPGSSEVVLLVEDQDVVRKLTERVLIMGGYRVLSAADPFGALELARRTKDIALIISDVVMPGMDGVAMIGILDEIIGRKPVLLMSGYAEDAIVARVAGRPGITFVAKPLGVADLLTRVRESLDGNPPVVDLRRWMSAGDPADLDP
jgi:PAS domain S-box-containing protein